MTLRTKETKAKGFSTFSVSIIDTIGDVTHRHGYELSIGSGWTISNEQRFHVMLESFNILGFGDSETLVYEPIKAVFDLSESQARSLYNRAKGLLPITIRTGGSTAEIFNT